MRIIQVSKDDISALQSIKNHPESVFSAYFERGKILAVQKGTMLLGYVFFNCQPKYNLYKRLGIAEIQDLNVHPDHRRQGYATMLIQACENVAAAAGDNMIGISVGLTADYGAAQRLYNKLGYEPDGNGVTYDRQVVTHGAKMPVDDDLCLMLIKTLHDT